MIEGPKWCGKTTTAEQLAPKLWDAIRFEVDHSGELGQFVLTGSAAVAALGIGPNDLLNDLKTFGLLFETLCVRDLRVYADALNGEVFHYRDKDGLECDAVVHQKLTAHPSLWCLPEQVIMLIVGTMEYMLFLLVV